MLHRYIIDIRERESQFVPKGHVTVTVERNCATVFEETGPLASLLSAATKAITAMERAER